jgi:hypothetical protein
MIVFFLKVQVQNQIQNPSFGPQYYLILLKRFQDNFYNTPTPPNSLIVRSGDAKTGSEKKTDPG